MKLKINPEWLLSPMLCMPIKKAISAIYEKEYCTIKDIFDTFTQKEIVFLCLFAEQCWDEQQFNQLRGLGSSEGLALYNLTVLTICCVVSEGVSTVPEDDFKRAFRKLREILVLEYNWLITPEMRNSKELLRKNYTITEENHRSFTKDI